MTRWFDTHAHLNVPPLVDTVDEVIAESVEAGLVGIAVIGIDRATSESAVAIARRHPMLHAVVGIQPNSVAGSAEGDFDRIVELAGDPDVVAIGETGLDDYWDDTPMADQRVCFDRHMQLCREIDKPMVIHMRECGDQIIDSLNAAATAGGVPPGVMHSFTGDVELARRCLDHGLMISFAGMVTFKKSESLRRVAQYVPIDRLLIETDSPYLSPEPLRGKRPNVPARVVHTGQRIAEVRGVSSDELAEQTTANAERFFGLT